MIGTQVPREKAGWALGILSTGALAGNLAGPLVGGLLPSLISIRSTFFAGGAMIAVAGILTIALVREDFRPETDAKKRTSADATTSKTANRVVTLTLLLTAMRDMLGSGVRGS
jgi:DHA1 family multidrug resistance protein-like MFS transporter